MADNGAPLILLTRPAAQSARCAVRLRGLAEIQIEPLIEIVADGKVPPLDGVAALIFTSENAVVAFASASAERGLPAWCVGAHTATAARTAGLSAKAGGGTADRLVASILAEHPTGRLLHMRGRHTRGAVAERLRAAGLDAASAVIYDQKARAATLAPLAANRTVFAPLYSPRTAKLFAETVGEVPGQWRPVCLSPAVRSALPQHLRNAAISSAAPTANAMEHALRAHISP